MIVRKTTTKSVFQIWKVTVQLWKWSMRTDKQMLYPNELAQILLWLTSQWCNKLIRSVGYSTNKLRSHRKRDFQRPEKNTIDWLNGHHIQPHVIRCTSFEIILYSKLYRYQTETRSDQNLV